MPVAASKTYTGSGLIPVMEPDKTAKIAVVLPAGVSYAKGTAMAQVAGTGTAVNDVQTITPGGTVSGGTWRILFNGELTSALAYNASAATIRTALAALPCIGSTDNVAVTGGGLDAAAVVITFQGALGGIEQNLVTVISSLTGSSPTATPAHTTDGKPAAGCFVAYDDAVATRNVAKGLLEYDCATDTEGRITLGTTKSAADHNATERSAPVWIEGYFRTADTVGLDANGVADLGKLITGTTSTLTDAGTVLHVR